MLKLVEHNLSEDVWEVRDFIFYLNSKSLLTVTTLRQLERLYIHFCYQERVF